MSSPYRRAAIDIAKLLIFVAAAAGAVSAYVSGLVWWLGKWWAVGLTFGPIIAALLTLLFLSIADDYRRNA